MNQVDVTWFGLITVNPVTNPETHTIIKYGTKKIIMRTQRIVITTFVSL